MLPLLFAKNSWAFEIDSDTAGQRPLKRAV